MNSHSPFRRSQIQSADKMPLTGSSGSFDPIPSFQSDFNLASP